MITDYKFDVHRMKLDPIPGRGITITDVDSNKQVFTLDGTTTVNIERDDVTGRLKIAIKKG